MILRLTGGTIVAMAIAAMAYAAEVRFETRGGVLYVTNAEPEPTPFSAARPGPKPKVPYDDLIRLAAARYGLPVQLLESVIRVESNFAPRAVSSKGARGLMQLMPETARLLGVADVFDVAQNIDGGARHLRNLVDRYDGNYSYALAAYNAGVEAVARHGGVPPFAETRSYVDRVLRLAGGDALTGTLSSGRMVRTAPDGDLEDKPRLYRYEVSDGTLVYSNLPIKPGEVHCPSCASTVSASRRSASPR